MEKIFAHRIARVVDGGDYTLEGYLDDGKIILIRYFYDESSPSITINVVDDWKQSYETYPYISGEVYERDVSKLGHLTINEVSRIVEEDTGISLIEDNELKTAINPNDDQDLFEEEIGELSLGEALKNLESRRDASRLVRIIAYEKKHFPMRRKNISKKT